MSFAQHVFISRWAAAGDVPVVAAVAVVVVIVVVLISFALPQKSICFEGVGWIQLKPVSCWRID